MAGLRLYSRKFILSFSPTPSSICFIDICSRPITLIKRFINSFSVLSKPGIFLILDGVVDGVLDGLLDGLLDGVVDRLLDGVVDRLLDGVVDGVLDGVVDKLLDGVVDGLLDGVVFA